MSGRRNLGLGLFLVAIVVVALEALSYTAIVGLRVVFDREIRTTRSIFEEQTRLIGALLNPDTDARTVIDSLLGWRYKSGFSRAGDLINSQGLRSDREYHERPDSGLVRVAAFGNSFVYCNEVDNAGSWPTILEKRFPGIEILNYGVGGYGTDQALLRFRKEGLDLSPHMVIIGFEPVDLRRTVNVYRRFISSREFPLAKPRYRLVDGELELIPNPLRTKADYEALLVDPRRAIRLGEHDHWYEPLIYKNPLYDISATVRLLSTLWVWFENRRLDPNRLLHGRVFNPSSESFQLQLALLERFARDVKASGAVPLVVVFPDRESLLRRVRNRAPVFAPLTDSLAVRGVEYVDLSSHLMRVGVEGIEDWFMPDGHYSPVANAHVADGIAVEIGASILEGPGSGNVAR